ncbi:methyltransferase domain-containing protein [Virgibacillus sp. C22-A2]|uniref:Methyltransferase domain-containing protein n=1 Tax=Virgibacillus tibetensis TaxID=3042313 RepID=A0ABU6KCG7_9BACI|nr:methyltransferase domain-containing protein [Virgibacillus sp. C22-A2]
MKEKDDVKRAFSKNKEDYVKSSTHASGSDLSLLPVWLNPKSTMEVLDIATGGGHVAKRLAPFVKRVVATDITKAMLENTAAHLAAYSNIDYVIADAESLPFLDNTFEIITCRIAAHHFPNPKKFVSEVNRVLKPNGKFLFIDNIAAEQSDYGNFINTLEKMRDYSHVRSLRISEWKEIFNDNKLTFLKQQERKKTLPYDDWINRTLDMREDKESVTNFIKNATSDIHDYYDIKFKNDNIKSFTIDEWMILLEKK